MLFIYGSRAAAYCHDGADGGVAASARRFANGFFLKQEIVSSSRRRRHARGSANCWLYYVLTAENSKHSCYDISRLSYWLGSRAVFSKVEN